jgi:hypothetical protein
MTYNNAHNNNNNIELPRTKMWKQKTRGAQNNAKEQRNMKSHVTP